MVIAVMMVSALPFFTPDRRQSKTKITSKNVDQKMVRNRVFHCHLSSEWRQMAIKNTVSRDFYLRSSIFMNIFFFFYCRLSGVFVDQ